MACGGLFVPSTQASHTQCLLDIAVFFVGNDDSLLKLCDLTHLPKQSKRNLLAKAIQTILTFKSSMVLTIAPIMLNMIQFTVIFHG